MRRAITVIVVAAGTAGALLWWLHDGDLAEAVAPALPLLTGAAPGGS
jgi:hypothetical protein